MSRDSDPLQNVVINLEIERGTNVIIRAVDLQAAKEIFDRYVRVCNGQDEEDETPQVAEPIDAEECPICYEPIGEKNYSTTECGHTFHTSCLIMSSISKKTCPCCRTQLVPEHQSQQLLSRTNAVNLSQDQPREVDGWEQLAFMLQGNPQT